MDAPLSAAPPPLLIKVGDKNVLPSPSFPNSNLISRVNLSIKIFDLPCDKINLPHAFLVLFQCQSEEGGCKLEVGRTETIENKYNEVLCCVIIIRISYIIDLN
jgi:hypothetical protein